MRIRRVPFFGSIVTLALVGQYASAGAQRPSRAALQRTVDSLVANALADGPVAAMSVAVVRGRDTVVMKGYGFADLENEVPATAQTVYRIGSITKQFTAAAVLQLIEQNKVALDDTIGKYLPTIPAAWRGVPVRQLLNHTSGIPSYTSAGPRWTSKMRLDLPHDSLLAIIAADSMDFARGSQWRYNNTGYYLLGMLIEKVTGRSYAEVVRDRLAAPLGLRATMYCETRALIKHRAQGYQPTPDDKLVNADPLSMNQPFAAGALCSTVGDLVAWQRALAAGRLVKSASYISMTTPEGAATDRGYGYGLSMDTLGGRARVQHGGGINGFNTMAMYYPADTLSIVVLANTNGPWADRIANNIARAALGAPLVAAPPRLADLPTTAEERARFAGTYRLVLPNGRTLNLRVFERDGKLLAQGDGQGEIPLRYQGNSTFGASFDRSMRLTFAPGNPTPKVTLLQGGATIDGPRVQ
ncbi:MAG TPA: serine hydrolase domain-containing protein [Gemmatimonadaceae bacterium]|nr:serine hydrolase domain-containing protein [Gemmatimonadaceae bacterium]